jgi:hypothetical protein
MVPGELKPAQRHLPHKMADMKTVGGGIEAAVKRQGAQGGGLGQLDAVGAIGNQTPPVQFLQNGHEAKD